MKQKSTIDAFFGELAWSPAVDEANLARHTGMSASDIATGLAWLSASS